VHPENTNTPKILVSACLAGFCCRYDGGHRLNPEVRRWVTAGKACAVCPEKLGGLRSPHPPCEIQGGGGEAVLDGKAKVLDREGRDVTSAYLQGSYRILELVKKLDVREAWLKSKSPACGYGAIFDGNVNRTLISGHGVTAARLRRSGVPLKSLE